MTFSIKIIAIIFFIILYEITTATSDENLFPLTVIHINDFHARYEQINTLGTKCKVELGETCIGGYARTVTAVKMLQERAENSIFLNAGDNFQGTLWYDLFKWNVTCRMLNLHPADAITLGNHEFDDRIDGIVPFLECLESPIVVANLDDDAEPRIKGLYKKSIVLTRGNKKIGIIGVILSSTPKLSYPEKLKFLNEIDSIQDEVIKLKEKKVDIIIVLSHCGITIDLEIARAIGEDIHVIVGAHSHTLLYTGKPPGSDKPADVYPIVVDHQNGKKTLIVQALAYSKYVGNLTVYLDDTNNIARYEGNPIYMDDNIIQDPLILEELKPFQDQVNVIGLRLIGSTKVPLEKDPCFFNECTYGNLINDAYVDYYVTNAEPNTWTYASISITNAGIIRIGLNIGNITYDDLATSHPYENRADILEIRGDHLLEALELSASNYGTVNFLQFSGLKVIYDVKATNGTKVKQVKVRCQRCTIPRYFDLNLKEYYRIVIASWIGNGGNGYKVFKDHRRNVKRGPPSLKVVTTYVEKISPIIKIHDGRINFI